MRRTSKEIIRVACFGDAAISKSSKEFKDVFGVAKKLAENGFIVVNGGGTGVMLAATLGAKAGGGRVETVVIDPKVKMGKLFKEECEENKENSDLRIEMPDYERRLAKLVEIADAFVIFKGGTGTLAEIGLVWNKAKIDYGHHEPLIFFGKEWEEITKTLIKDLGYEPAEKQVFKVVTSANEVIANLRSVSLIKKHIPWWQKMLNFVP
jgi:hypothetical protein